MNLSEQYDNPLTRFKKDLWSLCLSMKVFDHIQEDKVEQAKQSFENIVTNYQTQILQQDKQENDNMLKQTLLTKIKDELEPLKQLSRDSIQQNKKNEFDTKLEQKQNEFNNMMQKDIPETPQFGDGELDEPIGSENLDAMIQKQMKERENVLTLQQPENQIIANQSFVAPPVQQQSSVERIEQQLNQLNENLKMQSSILQKIIQSQIAILNKIK